jgi:hypothetical protein
MALQQPEPMLDDSSSGSSPDNSPLDNRKLSRGMPSSAPTSRTVLPDLLPQSRTPPQERARLVPYKEPAGSVDSQSVEEVRPCSHLYSVSFCRRPPFPSIVRLTVYLFVR